MLTSGCVRYDSAADGVPSGKPSGSGAAKASTPATKAATQRAKEVEFISALADVLTLNGGHMYLDRLASDHHLRTIADADKKLSIRKKFFSKHPHHFVVGEGPLGCRIELAYSRGA
eukprot:scpid16461/ scgid26489/ 